MSMKPFPKTKIVEQCASLAEAGQRYIDLLTGTENSAPLAWAKAEFHRYTMLYPLLEQAAMLVLDDPRAGHRVRTDLLELSSQLATLAYFGDWLSEDHRGGHKLRQVANHLGTIEIEAEEKGITSMRDFIAFARANPFEPDSIHDIYASEHSVQAPAPKAVDQRAPA